MKDTVGLADITFIIDNPLVMAISSLPLIVLICKEISSI